MRDSRPSTVFSTVSTVKFTLKPLESDAFRATAMQYRKNSQKGPPMSVNLCRTWTEDRELGLERPFSCAPERLFQAWTEPKMLVKWFAPKPWSVADVRCDLRIGGSSRIVMRSPDGAEFPNTGVYLEIESGRRLVVTDAYVDAWTPSGQPFMTLVLDFLPHEGGALYRARALHWSAADREKHEAMGFHQGWPICTEQLAALVEDAPTGLS
jgi:uncharacterized protein YndB with AHSA1/START domain